LSDEQVLRLIRDGIDESATHGIRAERDVARYIEFLVIFGPEFQSLGWAGEILSTSTLDGAGKMDREFAASLHEMFRR
jgi:hypothetical protein